MQKLRVMLKDQLKQTQKFEKTSKGLAVGDTFDEVLNDILHSDSICGFILSQVHAMGQSIPGVIGAMAKYTGEPATAQHIIRKNINAFMVPLMMFYYGIAIGRAVAAEEQEALQLLSKGLSAEQSPAENLTQEQIDASLSDQEKKWASDLTKAFEKFQATQSGETEIEGIEGNQV